jgi:FkbM family methyltransferase
MTRSPPRASPFSRGVGRSNSDIKKWIKYARYGVTGLIITALVFVIKMNHDQAERNAHSARLRRQGRYFYPHLPKYIQRIAGSGWDLWKGTNIMNAHMKQLQCDWTYYAPSGSALDTSKVPEESYLNDPNQMISWGHGESLSAVPICTHPAGTDVGTSQSLRESHHVWPDCTILEKLVKENGNQLHIEVGAGLGYCIVHLLLTTEAKIVAFEPTPHNIFAITSTLVRFPPEVIKDRVFLYPIALGRMHDVVIMQHNPMDSGASLIVGEAPDHNPAIIPKHVPGKDDPTVDELAEKGTSPVERIFLEKLDDIIDIDYLPEGGMSAVKIDVESFECSAIYGMSKVLGKTPALFYEHEALLEQSGSQKNLANESRCDRTKLFNHLRVQGFSVMSAWKANWEEGRLQGESITSSPKDDCNILAQRAQTFDFSTEQP